MFVHGRNRVLRRLTLDPVRIDLQVLHVQPGFREGNFGPDPLQPGGRNRVGGQLHWNVASDCGDHLADADRLNRPRRLLARLLDNVPWLVTWQPASLCLSSLPTVPGEWISFIYLSYHVSSYRLWSGHIGHLVVGERIRDISNGSRIILRQAAIGAPYDLAPLPVATLMVIPVLLLLVADGDRLERISGRTAGFQTSGAP